ncbi:nitrate/nitrite transporter [Massilia sp. TS11]|uniref:MFS transporter n=1 Tax=Massilia sp. TS11 TaxID=2908003 RepID=UPI001EDB709E|nr:MFS transporter [Massilia sp. TS11]MCG2585513.1 MFS transporter [Massilia sp. TS11]
MSSTLRGATALKVFLCFAAGYLISYGLRSVNAVIAPVLVADLHLSSADLGLLSSAYFVSFATLQLPLGVWLDRYGPRRIEAGLLLIAALGAAVFATATTLTGLWIGRALIGVGVSACLMAAFKAYRQWFAPEQQSRLASFMLVAGTSGALSATLPVTMAVPAIGWRGVFWVVAGAIVLVAAAIFFLLRDVERAHPLPAAAASADGAYAKIFGSAYFWRFALLGLINHGSFFALQTLWAGPWMSQVLGKTTAETSSILFVLNLVLMLAYLALGWAAPRLAARGWHAHSLIGWGIGAMLLAQLGMLFGGWGWWLVLALFVPVTTIVQSHLALAFPASQAGRINSAYNLQLFVGAFVVQWGIGVLIDVFRSHGADAATALRAALACCVGLQVLSWLHFLLRRVAAPAEN